MNTAEALDAVDDLCPFDDDPALSVSQQDRLLKLAATVDDEGRTPIDEEWTPTYDMRGVYFAARDGWIMKKARVAGRFDFSTDGQMFKRSQFSDHCDEMVRRLNAKIQQATSTA